MIKLIALDRDGVINKDSPDYIKSPDEWIALPGSLEAIAKLKQHGYKVVIITNQSGLARGYYNSETLDNIHKKMLAEIENAGGKIDGIFVCPHVDQDNCECRKPKPGLILQAANEFQMLPSEILVIGDATRDMMAAKNCGARAIFVDTNNKIEDRAKAQKENIPIYASLIEAADFICNNPSKL